jgi:hypothetical protein
MKILLAFIWNFILLICGLILIKNNANIFQLLLGLTGTLLATFRIEKMLK